MWLARWLKSGRGSRDRTRFDSIGSQFLRLAGVAGVVGVLVVGGFSDGVRAGWCLRTGSAVRQPRPGAAAA